jgi:hypothetical protein
MALSPLHGLGTVKASRATTVGGLHRLRIQTRRTGVRFRRCPKGGQIVGEHSPGTASTKYIQDGMNNVAFVIG